MSGFHDMVRGGAAVLLKELGASAEVAGSDGAFLSCPAVLLPSVGEYELEVNGRLAVVAQEMLVRGEDWPLSGVPCPHDRVKIADKTLLVLKAEKLADGVMWSLTLGRKGR